MYTLTIIVPTGEVETYIARIEEGQVDISLNHDILMRRIFITPCNSIPVSHYKR